VTLRTVAGRRTGENADDLRDWLTGLEGCPAISRTVLTSCPNPTHADEPATWFYVEADPDAAVARRRCLSCGTSTDTLDSAEHWNVPRMWSCPGCSQSIGEVAAGFHTDGDHDGLVSWVVLAIRCVECGAIDGLTDFNVDPAAFDEVAARI
jgi:hypothetical protein